MAIFGKNNVTRREAFDTAVKLQHEANVAEYSKGENVKIGLFAVGGGLAVGGLCSMIGKIVNGRSQKVSAVKVGRPVFLANEEPKEEQKS